MSKREVMVLASSMVTVAGGSLGAAPNPSASELGFMLLLAGLSSLIVFALAMAFEKPRRSPR